MAKFFESQRQCMAARVFAEHEFVSRNTHGFRRHDFVAQRIADHTVLMYTGFVREGVAPDDGFVRSEEHTSELQSLTNLVCRLLLEKKKNKKTTIVRIVTSTSQEQR